MNVIDQFVSFFSPEAGVKRARARMIEDVFTTGKRRYEAASISRRTGDWHAASNSSNTEIFQAARILRNRMRDLIRNNPYAKKATMTLVTNVVGGGIKPSIQHQTKRVSQNTKDAWRLWAESTMCDFERRKTFAGIQSMVMRAVCESGECFIRAHRDKNLVIPVCLQVLESDFLDANKDGIQLADGGYIQQGIEFDKTGRRVAYFLFEVHPGENRLYRSLTSNRIPESEILHVFYSERPGQIRGVPVGVSSMLKMKDLDEYADAELIRKKVAACFAVFVTDTNDPLPGQIDPDRPDDYRLEKVEPAMIEYLKPGQNVTLSTPPPSDGYSEYSATELRAIAAGFGVTYESMTGDLSNVNFSSGRMGWIEMGRTIAEYQQQMMIPVLCSGVWQWFLQAATIAGKAKEDVFASWTCPRREMIDPVKETKALSEQVRNGFLSWQDAIRQNGDDPEITAQELSDDYGMFEKLGFMLVCDPRFDPNRVDPANTSPPPAKVPQK